MIFLIKIRERFTMFILFFLSISIKRNPCINFYYFLLYVMYSRTNDLLYLQLSIIISPLRHNCVSTEVTRSVAQLLSIPLVVSRNPDELDMVLKVNYIKKYNIINEISYNFILLPSNFHWLFIICI